MIKETKDSPVMRLQAAAKEFNFSKLKADQDNKLANSGETMFLDFQRINFIINGTEIDGNFINAFKEGAKHRKSDLVNSENKFREIKEIETDNVKAFIDSVFEDHVNNKLDELWKNHCEDPEIANYQKIDLYKREFDEFYNTGRKYAHLLPTERDKNKDYRSFAKEIFKEIFGYAGARVPSNSILEELVTHCNQAGYLAAPLTEVQPTLGHSFIVQNPKQVISIDCVNSSNIRIRSDENLPISSINDQGMHSNKICDILHLLEFTLESQDDEDLITYVNGKVSLTIPKELKNYKDNGKNLFDIIKEYFKTLCTKLGFKIEKEMLIKHECGTKLDGIISNEGSDANKEFINLLSEKLRLSKENIRDSYARYSVAEKKEDLDDEDINMFIEHRISGVMVLLSDCAKLKNNKKNRELLTNEVVGNLGISKKESTLESLSSLMNGSVNHDQMQNIANIFTSLILNREIAYGHDHEVSNSEPSDKDIHKEIKGGINVIDIIHQKIGKAIAEQEREVASKQQDVKEHQWTDRIKEQKLSMKSHERLCK